MFSRIKILSALAVVGAGVFFSNKATAADSEWVFIASGHKDIYPFRLDLKSGELTQAGEPTPLATPSFLAITPNHKFLYAISEGGKNTNSLVSAFALDRATGRLTFINRQMTGGTGPCFVSIDPKGEDALIANYNSGSVSVFPIARDGALGEMSAFVQDHGSSINLERQEGPHAHCIVTDAADRFAFACDLGLDKVMIFKFDPSRGALAANETPFAPIKAGQGPRHIAFHPNGKFAYVVSEMGSTVTAFSYDAKKGVLRELENLSLLPDNFDGVNYAAEIAVHPNGKFVFASNRGEDTIVTLGCDAKTGKLTFLERTPTGGHFPRHFEIDPTGRYLLVGNQESGSVNVFRLDKKSGHLSPVGNRVKLDAPMCIQCLEY